LLSSVRLEVKSGTERSAEKLSSGAPAYRRETPLAVDAIGVMRISEKSLAETASGVNHPGVGNI
jgi:hypothetical protein